MKHTFPGLAIAVALSCLCCPLQAQKAKLDERLREAKRLFQSAQETEVRQGAQICVESNNVPAVELMLEVLNETRRPSRVHLHAAHYRDIVWEGLEKITDVYARRRVEFELRKNRKNAFVRQWCAHLLGVYGDHAFGGSLKRALSDRDRGVKRWAARALGWMKFVDAQAPLTKLIHHDDIYVRANAIEALANIDPAAHELTFLTALRSDKDGGVRCALLGAALRIYPERGEELSLRMLGDRDWRPRMQAVDNLAEIQTLTAIDGLIRATKDGRPVVTARALHILQKVTGQPIRTARVWEQWWKDHRATFEFPKSEDNKGEQDGKGDKKPQAGRPPGTVVYNDIPMDSDHAAFLIDRSVAMKSRLVSKSMPKEMAAYEELERVLTKLRGKMVFNVFGYHEEVKSFSKKPVELTAKNQKRALKFIKDMKLGIAKDIWQLLEAVIEDPTLDTAYLLSSGEPDIGTYVHWNRVTDHLKDMNRFHKVVVHTIAYSDRKWYRDQLEKIAQATRGEFRWFE